MNGNTLSPLAAVQLHHEDIPDRTAKIFGIAVHTTGRGVVEKARKNKTDPAQEACSLYLETPLGGHYVIDYSGKIFQVAGEQERMWHVGLTKKEREAFLSGAWEKQVSPKTLEHWKARWPQKKSPSHLYPGESVNNVYVGIELVPLDGIGDYTQHGKTWFTTMQHESLRGLCMDIAKRHNFSEGWHLTGRLAGHEDLNPLRRSDKGGGWDPGALRDEPRFDWQWLYDRLPGGKYWPKHKTLNKEIA